MKVILMQDISGFGQKGDVKEVKPGYWRNFLQPQNLAIEATEAALVEAEKIRAKRDERKEYEAQQLTKSLESLKDKVLKVEKKADETGSLFDKLDIKELAGLLKEEMRFEVPKDVIKLDKPINKLGTYEIPVGESSIKVEIVAEESKEKKEEEKEEEKK